MRKKKYTRLLGQLEIYDCALYIQLFMKLFLLFLGNDVIMQENAFIFRRCMLTFMKNHVCYLFFKWLKSIQIQRNKAMMKDINTW